MATDDEKQALKDVGALGVDSILNLAISFAVIFALNLGVSALGLSSENWSTLGFGLLLGLIFAEPMALIRGERSVRQFSFYTVAGLALGMVITLVTSSSVPGEAVVDEAVPAAPTEPDGAPFPWGMLMLFLIGPVVFALPLLEKILGVEKGAKAPSRDDIQISMAFPIFMSVSMFLNVGVTGALWLMDASYVIIAAVYLVGIVLVVMDVTYGAQEDAPGTDDAWGPRPETPQESWSNLRKGLSLSFASGLFMGATIYAALKLTLPADFGDLDANTIGFLGSFMTFAVLMLVVTLLLIALGQVLTAVGAALAGYAHGRDPLSIAELAKQATGRLLMGGMGWVRPDLPQDDEVS